MKRALFALASTVSLLPLTAIAQGQPPPALAARAVALQQRCQAVGGQVVNGDRPFVHNMDLTGDGRTEWIMDEAGFACSNRAVTSVTPTGAPLEVFDGATGQSLLRVMTFTYALQPGQARNTLMVTLRGPVCSPNAMATTTCQRPLTWNPQTRAFTGGPGLDAARLPAGGQVAAAAPAPKAAAPAPPVAPAGPMTLSAADRTAVFRAAGFVQQGGMWKGCVDDPRDYYRGGEISEVLDLNGDGRPEAVVAENSTFCHGQQGDWFAVLSKEANGTWRKVMDIDGMFVALDTRANGWREVMAGGPGFEHPVWRYNGREYVFNRRMRE